MAGKRNDAATLKFLCNFFECTKFAILVDQVGDLGSHFTTLFILGHITISSLWRWLGRCCQSHHVLVVQLKREYSSIQQNMPDIVALGNYTSHLPLQGLLNNKS
jgi:hypothetical protein